MMTGARLWMCAHKRGASTGDGELWGYVTTVKLHTYVTSELAEIMDQAH